MGSWSTVWPANLPRTLDYPEAGMDALLAGAAREHGARVAVRDDAGGLTYAELHAHVRGAAAYLCAQGVAPGDVVALRLGRDRELVVAYLAVLLAGAAAVPVDRSAPDDRIREHLRAAGAGVMLLDQVDPVRAAVRDHVALIPMPDLTGRTRVELDPVDPDLIAHLQPSASGRLVQVLHRNLVANALQVACWRSGALPTLDRDGGIVLRPLPAAASSHVLEPGAVLTVATAPLTHGVGLVGLAANLMLGATVVLPGRPGPEQVVASMSRHEVTSLVGSLGLLDALLDTPGLTDLDVAGVRQVVTGSFDVGDERFARLEAAFPAASIRQSYGLAEATAVVTMSPPEVPSPVPRGSVGVPVFDTEVEIRDPNGRPLPADAVGEICVRGPQVAEGHRGQPDPAPRVDGWLRTGDFGRLDEAGCLYLSAASQVPRAPQDLGLTELRARYHKNSTPSTDPREQAS